MKMSNLDKYLETYYDRDMERLVIILAKLRRKADRQPDQEDADAFRSDSIDLENYVAAIENGCLITACDIAYDMDTACRDYIPIRLYNAIENA